MKLRLITLLAIALITKLNVEAQQNSERPRLMAKSGPHQVGHVSFEWTDKARKELSTKDESDSRIVPVQIWYPAKAGVKGEMTAYRPRLASFKNQWEKETIDFVSSVQTGVIQEAMINQGPSFPVFIFSHGWNSKSSSYGTLLSNLASYGIIVVGMNHPYMGTVGMLDGTVAQADDSNFEGQAAANKFYAQVVSFILDKLTELSLQSKGRFEGKIDVSKVIA